MRPKYRVFATLFYSALLALGLASRAGAFFGWLDAPTRSNPHDPRSQFYHPTPGIKTGVRAAAVGTVTPVPTPTAQSTWRVHAGGAAYTDTQGNLWAADSNFSGGTGAGPTTVAVSGALPGAGDQALYQSQRYGASFSYSFPVPAGSYQVRLKFAETYWTAAGKRQFNVSINGATELTNFDIFAAAGGANIALDKVYSNIAASGGTITINFGPTALDNAEIQAIQVIPQPSPTATASPKATLTRSPAPTATPSPTATATQAPLPTSWHVRAGGPAYTDTLGQAWLADTGFSGGNTAGTTHAVSASGSDPVLYQTERWGNPFTYTFAVAPGSYQVTLKLAEIYWTAAGQRVFSASVNGAQVLSNLDLFAQVGGYVAYDKVINNVQPNSSGQIVITLGPASVDNAKVAAIAIIPQPSATATATMTPTAASTSTSTAPATALPTATPTAPPTAVPTATSTAPSTAVPTATPTATSTARSTATSTFTPTSTSTATLTPSRTATPAGQAIWRVHAGGAAYTDSQGNQWSADQNFSGGTAAGPATGTVRGALPGAADQALYQTQRYGSAFSYSFAVPAGSYQVTLKFAETYWTAAGKRQFNVSINGATVLTNFDIFAAAGGAYIALDKVYNNVAPSGGAITVNFGPSAVDNAVIQAIQVVPQPAATFTPTPTATLAAGTQYSWRVHAGGGAYTDTQGNLWAADENFNGGTVAAPSTAPVSGAMPNLGDQALYQDQRYGASFSYSFPVPAGSYQVTLKFAETYWTAAGKRQFNVSINGAAELTNFDIFAAAGGANIALDKVYSNIAASGGLITVSFGPAGVDNAVIQAIQVLPQSQVTVSPTPTRTPTAPAAGKYLVGYLPDYDGSFATFAHTLNFTKMTHLDICFALPPPCGGACTAGSNMAFSLGQTDADIATLVNAAHAAGVKVMVSIGGGDNASDGQVAGFYNAGLSTQLAASLDNYVTSHNLDGVDVDIEDPANMGAPYAAFVSAVLAKEHAGGRVVSAAVANWLQTQNVMSNATLQSFDFINIMTYSDLPTAQSDLAYFSSLGEPSSKMVLGVPFFGQSSSGDEQPFNVIVAAYPNAGQSNAVSGGSLNGGAQYSYVGFSEMAQETQLGAQYGGVMIWELSQDAPPPNSLLNIIQNNLPGGGPTSTPTWTPTRTPTATATTVASCPPPTPNFGPNVIIFNPGMSSASIQSQLDSVYSQQAGNQFGSARYAFLFMPGTYNNNVNVGYYTQVMGLGASPDSVLINGGVMSNSALANNNSTCNFWESAENLAVAPSGGTDQWAVSQACPMRRVHIKGNAVLEQNGGWASGGWLSDSLIDGQLNAGSQQQWISRNSQWGSWAGGSWNMVFVGDNNAPSGATWPNPPYTVVNQSPVVREKPYLQVDGCGNFSVFVPSLGTNTQGTTWLAGSTPGKSIPLSQFYIARSSVDTAATLNAALAQGLNLLLTPGVYSLNGTLNVNNPNAVVLGLGLATLLAQNGVTAMSVADVDGVTVAGILFDAGATSSPVLLQVGPSGSGASHAANPTLLSDLFFRVGGAAVGKANVCLQINSNNVIGDDFWIWRADHSNGVGWTVNTANNGLVVNGANVTIYGLACEHFEQYQTLWNGNGGQVYFYQSEAPYDVPNQASWMAGTENGYASYKVADTVTSHQAYGLGVYCNFSTNPAVILDNAMEVPSAGLNGAMLHNMVTVSLGGVGQITHILDGWGPTVNSGSTNATLIK